MNRNNPCNMTMNPDVNQPINEGIYAPDDHHPAMSRDRILHMQGIVQRDSKRSPTASTLTGSPLDDIPGFAGDVIATYDDTETEGKLKDFAGTADMTLAGTVSPVPNEFLGFKKAKRVIFTPSANGTLRLLLKNSTGTDSGNTVYAPRTDNEHFHFTLSRDDDTPFASIPFYVQYYGSDTLVDIFSDAGDITLFYSHDSWTNQTLIVPTTEIDETELSASYDMIDSFDDSGTIKIYDRISETYNATVTDATVGGETGTTLTGDGTKVDRALGESIVMPTASDVVFHRQEVAGEYPLVTMPEIPAEPTFSGSTIVVDAAGGGDYTTISAAITAASAGDIIEIRNGTYTENVVVDKAVKLIGESRDGVIIDGDSAQYCIHITANGVMVDSVSITGGGDISLGYGIFLEHDDIYLKNLNVNNNSRDGIGPNGNGVVIDSCLVQNNRYGVYSISGTNIYITNLNSTDNTRSDYIFASVNVVSDIYWYDNVVDRPLGPYPAVDSRANLYAEEISGNGEFLINVYSSSPSNANIGFIDVDRVTLDQTAILSANVLIADSVAVDATATLNADIHISPTETTVNHGTYYHIGLLSDSLTEATETAVLADFVTVPEEPTATVDDFLFRATDFNGTDQYGTVALPYGAEGSIAIRWSAFDLASTTRQTILSLYEDADNYTSLSFQSGDLLLEEVESGTTTETLTLTPSNSDVQMSFITWSATSLALHNASRGESLTTDAGTDGITAGGIFIGQLGNDTQWAKFILRRLSVYDRVLTDEEVRILIEHNLQKSFTYAPNTSFALLNSDAMPSYATDDNYKVAQVYDGTEKLTAINDERIPLTADVVNLYALFKPTTGDDQELFSKTDGATNILTITYNATAKTLTASAEDGVGNKTATISALEQRWIGCHVKLKDNSLELYASDGLTSGIATASLSTRQKDADLAVTIGDGLNGRIAELNIWEGEDDWMSDDLIINNIHQEVGWQ